MTSAFRIAVLGADRSGKTRLAHELRTLLAQANVQTDQTFQVDDDPPLYTVLAAPHPHAILLCGLDLVAADSTYSDQDTHLRQRLATASAEYKVVYGQGDARSRHALAALGFASPDALRRAATRPWRCEKCSDPDCERRLFQGLLQPPD